MSALRESFNPLIAFPKKITFNEHDESIIISHRFLSKECCLKIIQFCEEFASSEEQWQNEDDSVYPQATFDLEVEKNHGLVSYIRIIKLLSAIDLIYKLHYNQTINSFDDVFVVKYQAIGDRVKPELIEHIDAGDISFMIALSERGVDYSGGGTYFRVTDSVVHLNQGDMITFDAKLYHGGVKITSGVRYLLVGFCHTDNHESVRISSNPPASDDIHTDKVILCKERGNLSKSLQCLY